MVFVAKCLIFVEDFVQRLSLFANGFPWRVYLPKSGDFYSCRTCGDRTMSVCTNVFLSTCYQRFDTKRGMSVVYVLFRGKTGQKNNRKMLYLPLIEAYELPKVIETFIDHAFFAMGDEDFNI